MIDVLCVEWVWLQSNLAMVTVGTVAGRLFKHWLTTNVCVFETLATKGEEGKKVNLIGFIF